MIQSYGPVWLSTETGTVSRIFSNMKRSLVDFSARLLLSCASFRK